MTAPTQNRKSTSYVLTPGLHSIDFQVSLTGATELNRS